LTIAETTPGYATPMPEQPFSSSPAWDPSSRTPISELEHLDAAVCDDRTPRASSSNALTSSRQDIQHLLLDPRLLGIDLKVIVSGEKDKDRELVASLTSLEGRLSIRRDLYNKSEYLSPELVSPKHPNPTRDNGLLVVIKGEHCGKYVRRIHHAYHDQNENVVILLAVVMRTVDVAESLTEERLQLDRHNLCVGSETKEERERGDFLVRPLREEARKKRAK